MKAEMSLDADEVAIYDIKNRRQDEEKKNI